MITRWINKLADKFIDRIIDRAVERVIDQPLTGPLLEQLINIPFDLFSSRPLLGESDDPPRFSGGKGA